MSASTIQKLALETDAPIKRAIYDTRDPEDEARERGALIIYRLESHPAWPTLPTASLLLLHRICLFHGVVEEHSAGLILRDGVKAVAARMKFAACSAYRPLRALIAADFIRRIHAWGDDSDDYEVPMPAPTEAEIAEANKLAARAASDTAAQLARAGSHARLDSHTLDAHNRLTEPDLARAGSHARLDSHTLNSENAGLSTEKPGARAIARACSTIHDDDDISSFMERTGEDPEAVFQILVSIGQGKGPGRQFDAGVARKQSTLISLVDAMALKIMVEDSPFLKTPGGWANSKLKAGEITDDARQRARRKLAPKPAAPTPPPDRTAATVKRENAQTDAIIGRLSDNELAALADQILKKYDGNGAVINVLTLKPIRECRLMKWEIAELITAGPSANEVKR